MAANGDIGFESALNVMVTFSERRGISCHARFGQRLFAGITPPAGQADVGSILAFGFAPYTGGTLSYIDGMGAANFVALAGRLRKKYGAQFKGRYC